MILFLYLTQVKCFSLIIMTDVSTAEVRQENREDYNRIKPRQSMPSFNTKNI